MSCFSNVSFPDYLRDYLATIEIPPIVGYVNGVPYYGLTDLGDYIFFGIDRSGYFRFFSMGNFVPYFRNNALLLFSERIFQVENEYSSTPESHAFFSSAQNKYAMTYEYIYNSFEDCLDVVLSGILSNGLYFAEINKIIGTGGVSFSRIQYDLMAYTFPFCNLDFSPIVRLLGGTPYEPTN